MQRASPLHNMLWGQNQLKQWRQIGVCMHVCMFRLTVCVICEWVYVWEWARNTHRTTNTRSALFADTQSEQCVRLSAEEHQQWEKSENEVWRAHMTNHFDSYCIHRFRLYHIMLRGFRLIILSHPLQATTDFRKKILVSTYHCQLVCGHIYILQYL